MSIGWGSPGPSRPPEAPVRRRMLLRRLRDLLAKPLTEPQARLDEIVRFVASSMVAEVCSLYLLRGDALVLSATQGLNPDAVHHARLRPGEGLVGVIARDNAPISTDNARAHPDFRYLPETGEEAYSSFLGVSVQRFGKARGVLTVQNSRPILYDEEEVEALELVAAVIADLADAGALPGPLAPSGGSVIIDGASAAEGVTLGVVVLHEARVALPDPIALDVDGERTRLHEAMQSLRGDIDQLLDAEPLRHAGEHRDVLEAFRMFAHDRGWLRRLEASVDAGLTAAAAVDRARSENRARLNKAADPYLRERLHDLDELAERLLRKVLGVQPPRAENLPENAILVARALGPGELMEYRGGRLKAVVLEEGSPGAHVAIVARALGAPLVVQARGILREAEPGDAIVVDGDTGRIHLRPGNDVLDAYREKVAFIEQQRALYAVDRDKPCVSRCGRRIELMMNAGLLADMPSLRESGAEGVGLLRTEMQFLIHDRMPLREAQTLFYREVFEAAGGLPVVFRTLDIGSDKRPAYLSGGDEANPAMGWRALRMGLDRPALLRMQFQAMMRAAGGRPLRIMFPMVSDAAEFFSARSLLLSEAKRAGIDTMRLSIGTMLETPSLAYAPDAFFRTVDFISIGGNDLVQFFFAADRENAGVARRYDALHPAFLRFLEMVVARCDDFRVPLSFCGEAAGQTVEAVTLAAMGIDTLSMRPASIGPVKRALSRVDLTALRPVITDALKADESPRGLIAREIPS